MSGADSEADALFDLDGRAVLVLGASGALGAATALCLAGRGVRLGLVSGNSEALELLHTRILAMKADAEVHLFNGRPDDESSARTILEFGSRALGSLDGLVVASGLNLVAPVETLAVDAFDAVMQANVRSVWLVSRAASSVLADGASVVLISSTRGRFANAAGYTAYCASKGAVDMLTRTLALEWAKRRIRVNAVAPTVFRSAMTEWMYDGSDASQEVQRRILERIPLGRTGLVEDLLGPLVFLLRDASAFMTGQVMYVDGGFSAG